MIKENMKKRKRRRRRRTGIFKQHREREKGKAYKEGKILSK
jgi:hypothetical protein